MSLVPACSGARVCHEQGRAHSIGSADWSINSAELVERCPLTTRRLVKRVQRRQNVTDERRATAERAWLHELRDLNDRAGPWSTTAVVASQPDPDDVQGPGLDALGNKASQT